MATVLFLMPALGNSPKKANDKSYTPENSVIFYGGISGNKETVYFQTDKKFEPDLQTFKGEIIVSNPVVPGSNYRIFRFNGKGKSSLAEDLLGMGTVYEWESIMPINYYGYDIKIPSNPGALVFIGSYDGYETSDKWKYCKNTKDDEYKIQLICLKEALKKYKGTAWEPVIAKEIEQVKSKIRENK